MKRGIAEIFEMANKKTGDKAIIEVLQENHSSTMETIFLAAWNPQIKFLLPEGAPPYKVNPNLDMQGALYTNIRKMYLFVNSAESAHLKPYKREILFIQFLEGLDKDDAALICAVKDKKIPYKKITKRLVKKAFPHLDFGDNLDE